MTSRSEWRFGFDFAAGCWLGSAVLIAIVLVFDWPPTAPWSQIMFWAGKIAFLSSFSLVTYSWYRMYVHKRDTMVVNGNLRKSSKGD